MFVEMKDDVFKGNKPYCTEPLEEILRREFGDAVMTDVQKPKIMMNTTLIDRSPAGLHTFRNFTIPGEDKPDPEAGELPALYAPHGK